jgi:hypothetical protein
VNSETNVSNAKNGKNAFRYRGLSLFNKRNEERISEIKAEE